MPNALILGANTATGAYLARLVQARGANLFAVNDETPADGLGILGVTDKVNPVPAVDAARLAATLGDTTVYAVNTGSEAQNALIDEVFAGSEGARLCHIADTALLRHNPAMLAQAKAVADLRREKGRHAVNALLHAHDSRLGPVDSLPAQITIAAFRAGQGLPPTGIEITETGLRDWGWTAEYVDAIARLAALDRPVDLAIGSGKQLDVRQFTDLAFAFFKANPEGHLSILPAVQPPEPLVDTARLKAATGWSASTWGRDLVHALCEGAAARA
jgi:GDPmannose 4,6-dehydratase